MNPDLSVVIVSYNTCDLLCQCLESVAGLEEGMALEVVVVDNGSTDGTPRLVQAQFPKVQLVANQANRGFAAAANQGLARSFGRCALLLNSDTIVRPGTLGSLVSFIDSHPDAGAIGPRLIGGDGESQPYSYGRDPTLAYLVARAARSLAGRSQLHDWSGGGARQVDWVSGAAMVLRRQALEQIGDLDERFFMYFEDDDLCRRLRQAGWVVYFVPEVAVVHLGQPSRMDAVRLERYRASLRWFYRKHYGRVALTFLDLGLAAYDLIRRERQSAQNARALQRGR